MIFVTAVDLRVAGGTAETAAPPCSGLLEDSSQHQLYGTAFIFHAS